MSVIVTIDMNDAKMRVEFHRDGSISILDHNVEYDATMVEFGEPESAALGFHRYWYSDPASAIAWYTEFDFKTIIRLAADWAEHALPVFEEYHHNKGKAYTGFPRNALDSARAYADHDFDLDFRKIVFNMESKIHEMLTWQFYKPGYGALRAVYNVLNSSQAQDVWATRNNVEIVADAASTAVASNFPRDLGDFDPKIDEEIFEQEQAWQVRRFVDCMEAMQAGRPWPPLGATK